MKLARKRLEQLKITAYNPRKISEQELEKLKRSIKEFGYVEPIVWNERTGNIVGGNQRAVAMRQLGIEEADVVVVDLDEKKEKALNIALNKISGEWDIEKLSEILNELKEDPEIDFEITGFDLSEYEQLLQSGLEDKPMGLVPNWKVPADRIKGLYESYVIPPFSVFDGRLAKIQERKRVWIHMMEEYGQTREGAINDRYGTSIFHPVLAEALIRWFSPAKEGNKILDTFAGGCVRGFVATTMGNYYTGIELRQEQIDVDTKHIDPKLGKYICDDARNVDKYVEPESQDLYLSCPPYFDLEVYSDLPNDASNQKSYEQFYAILDEAFRKAVKCLKQNRFAIVVVGDVRNKKTGAYYDFVGDVKKTFRAEKLHLYNEMIVLDAYGTASVRARKYMSSRKLVKVHQNVLIFYKGDPRKIQEHFYDLGEYDWDKYFEENPQEGDDPLDQSNLE